MKKKQFSMLNKSKHSSFFLVRVFVVVFILMVSVVFVYDRLSTSPVDSNIAVKHFKLYVEDKIAKLKPYFPTPKERKKL
ncbi:MAG: hypothetical protein HOF38_01190 [Elusimicrobiaceae bacterium]|jgi:hypothetical protein|nr:hypothetical protein [Elusimicrobiaceae bacterium]MBT3954766.1 hypothetical protein [Elusimicrobiaceae bacterium]MBT4008250.1 hypothetical protein [Elusimicrobiaceae bacterium]MBT4402630.1 hypothetical protein [Elusimicrobiaceae bacterium]MBT4439834.1 hypothetical protein [Elusimicrobiaceae bacterium]